MNTDVLIKKWQEKLNLSDWKIGHEFVVFNRADGFPQRGDIKVNLAGKTATILLKKDVANEETIVHELVHLFLWDLDHYAEDNIDESKKDNYFAKLEKTVADLASILQN